MRSLREVLAVVLALVVAACGSDDAGADRPRGTGGLVGTGGGTGAFAGTGGGTGGAPDERIVRLGAFTELTAVAFTGDSFLVVGRDSDVLRSADGEHFWPHQPEFFSGDLLDVLWDGRRFFAVSSFGSILSSEDGTSFSTPYFRQTGDLAALAWSGSTYVAVGEDGSIHASSDGESWSAATSGTDAYLSGITWGRSQFVAVGAGAILTSPDGMTWTPREPGSTAALSDVLWTGTSFLAVGSGVAASSPDGVTWTTSSVEATLESVAWSEPLGLYVAAGWNGALASSSDGVLWDVYADPTGHTFNDVMWAVDRFVAVGEHGYVVTSRDGRTWTAQSFGFSYLNLARVDDRLIAVGSSGIVSTSTDGLSWEHGCTGGRDDFGMDIAWSGTRWVIGGQGGLVSSSELGNWPPPPRDVTGICRGIVWTGTQFAAACDTVVYLSPDGVDFESHFPATPSDYWNDITWTGAELVVVGTNGVVATSRDGVSWTSGSSGTTEMLNSVVWAQERLVAVGSSGTVLTSSDGISWEAGESGTTSALRNVAWIEDRFVATGDSETIIVSTDGVVWTEVPLPEGSFGSLGAAATLGDRLVVVGENGSVLALPRP